MKSFIHRLLMLPKSYLIGGGVVALVIVVVGVQVLTRAAPTPTTYSQTPQVTLASVATLSSPAGPLPVTGKVTSVSQATILAQTSGEIVRLYHGIGDHVAAGDVIAAFENSSQQAAVLQAQGAYDAALAAYQKAANTTAQNSGITSGSAATAAQTQQTAALGSLASAYGSLDDAVHTKADVLFNSPRTSTPIITLTVPDSALVSKLQGERVALEGTLTSAATLTQSPQNIDTQIQQMIAAAQQTVNFLNDLIQAVNETPPSQSASATTLSGYQTSLAAARTEAAAAITSLTTAKNSYDSALASASTSANSASSSATSDVAAAAATLKQQQGALDAAKANLQKTLVVSPISGTIVSLPITQGDFVNSFAQVAIVSNPGALYVDTAVTSSDAQTLAVGNGATVEGSVPGVITFIAPALDPTTNKIEVKVGLKGDQSSLTDGEEVTVSLNRSQTQKTTTTTANSQAITIPIVAAKILPTGPVVFTVTASSTLAAHPITLGTILGDQITVVSGLTPDMTIVTDARGLSDGETVEVNTQ